MVFHFLHIYIYSFLFLFLENYGVRKLEAIFAILILTMALSFAGMFAETRPNGTDLLRGNKIYIYASITNFISYKKAKGMN